MPKILYPPNFYSLPDVVLKAEILRGTLVPCGPGVRGVGWPDSSVVRSATLHPYQESDLVFIQRTAAWVWGAPWNEHQMIEMSTINAKRFNSPPHPGVSMHEYRIKPQQTISFNGVIVTNVLRTICDLLFFSDKEFDDQTMNICLTLISKYQIELVEIKEYINEINRPSVARSIKRALTFY